MQTYEKAADTKYADIYSYNAIDNYDIDPFQLRRAELGLHILTDKLALPVPTYFKVWTRCIDEH